MTLLQGVTGSGKTDVYAAAAARAIARGGQVLLLVPEINLTPQLGARFAAALPGVRIATLHSGLPDGERLDHWIAAARGDAALVVGTRLAVYAPLPRLALAIVDEEHDASYKQQDGVRYHARDVAITCAPARAASRSCSGARRRRSRRFCTRREGATCASCFRNARTPVPARPRSASFPRTTRPRATGSAARSWTRYARGSRAASSRSCSSTGAATPRRSSARRARGRPAARDAVRASSSTATRRACACHHCGHAERIPRACPSCGNVDLHARGLRDAAARGGARGRVPGRAHRPHRPRHDAHARRVRGGARAGRRRRDRHPRRNADAGEGPRLPAPHARRRDRRRQRALQRRLRAAERLAALLFQVAGRAGRAALPGEVVVQTAFPAHAVYRALAADDYDALAADLLEERRIAALPPHAHLALLAAEAVSREEVDRFLAAAERDAHAARDRARADVEVHSPVPSLLARRAGHERAQLVVQASRRPELARFLDAWLPALAAHPGRRVRWGLDVDPISL